MNFLFFGLEFIAVSALLLGAYRLKDKLGMSGLAATVASLQFLQAVVAATYFWEMGDGLYVNPSSAILFVGNLAILLYAFARDGAIQARTVLYAVVIGNIAPAILGGLLGAHVELVEPVNLLDIPPSIFGQGLIFAIVGIVVLYVDQLLAVISFSWLRATFERLPLALAMTAALVVTLSFDTVAFLTVLFWNDPQLSNLLLSGLISKNIGGLIYGVVWGLYLQTREPGAQSAPRQVLDIMLFQENIDTLREASTTDPMTGLLNRRAYDLMLGEMLDEASRTDGERFAFLLCDIDHFKSVNDTLGHTEGDRILREIAEAIDERIRGHDSAFRIGGDEFLILLPDSSLDEARDVAERISNVRFSHPELDEPVTLTIGIAAFPDDGLTQDALFDAADRRLYEGKSHGRNRVVAAQ
ncbi:MAG: GGDEF domain-containing protein [Persicimonas sp.]